MVTRQTRFSDVCGTMDEFKRLHGEEYERVLGRSRGAYSPRCSMTPDTCSCVCSSASASTTTTGPVSPPR